MSDLYKTIDELLTERGITGAKMSSDLGMSRSFMTELRKGRAKSIKTETAKKIADYFGVSTDYLLGNVNDPFFHLDNERILTEINSYEDNEIAPTVYDERFMEDLRHMDFKDLISMSYSDESFDSLQKAFSKLSLGASDEQKAKIFEHLKLVIAQVLSSTNE